VVLLGIVLLTAGAGIGLLHPAFLVSPHDEINGAVHVYAGYFVSRNLGIALMLLVALCLRGRSVLSNMVMLTGLIQILDGAIDVWEGRWPIAPGVFILGLLFLAAAWRLSGFGLWQKGAWTGLVR
jgi:hypothetical protein